MQWGGSMKSSDTEERIQAIPLPVESGQLPWYRRATAALLGALLPGDGGDRAVALGAGRRGRCGRGSSWRPVRSFGRRGNLRGTTWSAAWTAGPGEPATDRAAALQGLYRGRDGPLLGCSRRHVARLYPIALDRLSAICCGWICCARGRTLVHGRACRRRSRRRKSPGAAANRWGGSKRVKTPQCRFFAVSC